MKQSSSIQLILGLFLFISFGCVQVEPPKELAPLPTEMSADNALQSAKQTLSSIGIIPEGDLEINKIYYDKHSQRRERCIAFQGGNNCVRVDPNTGEILWYQNYTPEVGTYRRGDNHHLELISEKDAKNRSYSVLRKLGVTGDIDANCVCNLIDSYGSPHSTCWVTRRRDDVKDDKFKWNGELYINAYTGIILNYSICDN